MKKFTSIEHPFFLYDTQARLVHDNLDDQGVLVLGVENLPAELPVEASNHFGEALVPFLESLASSDGSLSFEKQSRDLPPELHGAIVTNQVFKFILFCFVAITQK